MSGFPIHRGKRNLWNPLASEYVIYIVLLHFIIIFECILFVMFYLIGYESFFKSHKKYY